MRLIKKLLVLSTLSAALAATSAGVIAADAKPTIKIGYVEGWDDSVATSNVAAQIIEKKLGYPVQLVPVAAGVMWQGVARGDLDATLVGVAAGHARRVLGKLQDEGRRPRHQLS